MHLIPRLSLRRSLLVPVFGLALLLSACGGDDALTATTVAPTNTVAAAPTDTVAPTNPPTSPSTTAPTDTAVPPTDAVALATATAVAPLTAIPPTATAVPPTVAPPTRAPVAPTKAPTKRPTPVPAPTKAPTTVPAPAVVYVKVVDFAFDPPSITVPAGTKVIWTNIGPTDHTVADVDVNWSSEILHKNDAYSHVFTQPGTVTVICTLHPDMVSTVIVK